MTASSSEHILVETRDRVAHLRMHRPKRKNALTLAMYDALAAAIEAAEADDEVRVITLRGSDDCFSAGNDIGDFAKAAGGGELHETFRFLKAIAGATKPLVAGVDGVAIGVGTTMLLHCDLVYATERARFRTPFVDLGLVPEAASSLLLPALLGPQRAAAMVLLGEDLGAAAALEAGLVNALVAPGELDARVEDVARRLAARAPQALRASKALLRRASRAAIDEAMMAEGKVFLERLRSPEVAEAITAFMTRRPADFSRFR
jgi:enoyl-CoA hydratase/carnithine racemase